MAVERGRLLRSLFDRRGMYDAWNWTGAGSGVLPGSIEYRYSTQGAGLFGDWYSAPITSVSGGRVHIEMSLDLVEGSDNHRSCVNTPSKNLGYIYSYEFTRSHIDNILIYIIPIFFHHIINEFHQ